MIKLQIEAREAYSQNIITGKWWDLDNLDDIQEIYDYYGSDNLVIVDSDVDIEGLLINEDDNIVDLIIINEELNALSADAIARIEYMLFDNCDIQYALGNYNNVMMYNHTSLKDLAKEFVEGGEYGHIPRDIYPYIDYESMGDDLSLDYIEFGGKIFSKDY